MSGRHEKETSDLLTAQVHTSLVSNAWQFFFCRFTEEEERDVQLLCIFFLLLFCVFRGLKGALLSDFGCSVVAPPGCGGLKSRSFFVVESGQHYAVLLVAADRARMVVRTEGITPSYFLRYKR